MDEKSSVHVIDLLALPPLGPLVPFMQKLIKSLLRVRVFFTVWHSYALVFPAYKH